MWVLCGNAIGCCAKPANAQSVRSHAALQPSWIDCLVRQVSNTVSSPVRFQSLKELYTVCNMTPAHAGSCYSWMRMSRRGIPTFTLVLIAALLLNSQCYARCLVCVDSSPHASGCHHSEKNHSSGKACPHQHSDLFSPAVGIGAAKLVNSHVALAIGPASFGPIRTIEIQHLGEILNIDRRHSLPGTSVFALLSTFRV